MKPGNALVSLQFPTGSLNALLSPRLLTLMVLFGNSNVNFFYSSGNWFLTSLPSGIPAYLLPCTYFSFISPQLSPFPLLWPVLIPVSWILCTNPSALYFTLNLVFTAVLSASSCTSSSHLYSSSSAVPLLFTDTISTSLKVQGMRSRWADLAAVMQQRTDTLKWFLPF